MVDGMRKMGGLVALAAILLAALACNTPGIVGTPDPEPTVTVTPEAGGDAAPADVPADEPTEAPAGDATGDDAGDDAADETPTEEPDAGDDADAACEPDSTFVEDVTVPDGTEVEQGASVVKTWLLRNDGTCAWDSSYQMVQIGGSSLRADGPVALPAVEPGDDVQISVTVTLDADAPVGSDQRATFQMRTPEGESFGATPFVEVTVVEAEAE